MRGRLIARFAIRETLGVALVPLTLLGAAADPGWWAAWAATGLTFAWVLATAVVVVHVHPELLAERLGPRRGARGWDTTLMGIYGVVQLATLVVAGLDHRFGWTEDLPLAARLAAICVVAAGHGLVVWATVANAYFSQIVRIQTERRHAVATGGPYRFVRHPGYSGTILTALGTAVLLSSWGALALALLASGLLVLRTRLEDRTLQRELPGYIEYAQRVRGRLIPLPSSPGAR